MILYNPTLADVETDNHWLPTVHLADGTQLPRLLAAHPGATASFTAGREGQRAGRRDGGVLLARPGRAVPQARHHRARRADPGRQDADPGRRRRAARPGSTSRRSPAPRCRRRTSPARPILLKALHPTWTPGPDQVRADDHGHDRRWSRRTSTTPADPFDFGAGRVDLTKAGNPGLTFDETADNLAALGQRPAERRCDLEPAVGQRPGHAGHAHHDPDGEERHQRKTQTYRSSRRPRRRQLDHGLADAVHRRRRQDAASSTSPSSRSARPPSSSTSVRSG